MTMRIALLRGVNVGGKKMVAMAELRAALTAAGLGEVTTLLQSGNVILDGGRRARAALEALLERETLQRVGLTTSYFVRTPEEWQAMIARNPFPIEARDDPGHLVALLLKTAVDADTVRALQQSIAGPEVVRGAGSELFLFYPAGMGTSMLTNAVLERKLGTRVTARNWNTVLKLAAIARS